ncbi:rhodanese-like domain-containing protein [Oryzomonas rubra]|uniref:Sulfurtransferase n=1 Tax=Oryzomonas rubra TaxID=2509454 RepID=A0A5A9X5G4_9BACT|nr:rhodanese-like domain-containing protein [Oryzomonas rubra]KAA0888317.1 sulfurtransferase [Oryzomonas rubra]
MIEGLGVTVNELKSLMKRGDQLFFVDDRHHQDWDWAVKKVRGALRLNDDEVEKHLKQIPRDRTIIVYSTCPGDERSSRTAKLLQQLGWNDSHFLVGGFNAYCEEGLPVEDIGAGDSTKKIMLL